MKSESLDQLQSQREELLTEREAAQFLRMSIKTLQARRLRCKPPRYIKLGRAIRYRVGDLEEWINESSVSPAPSSKDRQ